jgi:hypothetical protein
MIHNNRAIQIWLATQLDQLYHVRTEVNCANVWTRQDKWNIEDVGVVRDHIIVQERQRNYFHTAG